MLLKLSWYKLKLQSCNFRMLNVILWYQKKIPIGYTKKEMTKEFKHFIVKNQPYIKEDSMQEVKGQEAVSHVENKWKSSRSLFYQ